MDREKFEQTMQFCSTHPNCVSTCPAYNECKGAYDMLYMTFDYVKELTKENKRLRRGNNERC